jgi:phosphatidylglycerol lysyltransferase
VAHQKLKISFKKYFLRGFPLFFAILSLWFFYSLIAQTSAHQISVSIKAMSLSQLSLSTLLSALSFFILGCAEILAFYFLKEDRVSRQDILKVSFLSFGIGNALPMGGIAASTVRFRLYARHNLSSDKIIGLIAFSSLGGWLGFLCLAGLMSFAVELFTKHPLPLSSWAMRSLGTGFLCIVILYLFLSFKKSGITLLNFKIQTPSLRISLFQIMISMADWIIVSLALFILLPAQYHFQFLEFFLVFLFSQIIGVVVHAPGGIGILEFLFFSILLSGQAVTTELIASFLIFRLIYTIIPFGISLIYFAWREISTKHSKKMAEFLFFS